jgi:hypothetical protein
LHPREWPGLEQAANDYQILEEMDQLVLIGEVSMKEHGRCQRKRGNDHRCRAGAVPDQEQRAATQFHPSAMIHPS